jgi:hypothetical protein
MYEFKVVSGTDTWIIPFETLTVSETLNGGISGNLELNYLALERYSKLFSLSPDDIFSSDLTEWKLYRDGVIFYAGIFNHRKVSGSKTQGTSYSVNLLGYEYLLKSRYTGNAGTWAYLDDDSADIAWDLINQTNTDAGGHGATGITRGLHPSTVHRDKTCRYDNIYEAIVSMSAAKKYNGYDWTVSPLKVFDIFYPKGQTRANMVLDDFNILSWTSDRDISTNLANRVIVVGAGFDDAIIAETVNDATSQDVWGLQETVLSEKNTTVSANLIDKGNLTLNDKSSPKDLITLKVRDTAPDVSSYDIGDTLPVKIKTINFNKNLRIDRRTIQIQRSGEAVVDLSFQYVA